MNGRAWVGWLQGALLVLGFAFIGLWSVSYVESRGFQLTRSRAFAAALREATGEIAGTGAPALGAPVVNAQPGDVLGRIEIPRLRIRAIIAEGSDATTLKHAVGHISSTALPGHDGNCALAGHRDTFLRALRTVRTNDVIRVVTIERTYTYEVEWTDVVEPHRVDVLDSTATRSLTLVTCYPFEFVGHAPQRFIVRARQIEAIAGRIEQTPDAAVVRGRNPDGPTQPNEASITSPRR